MITITINALKGQKYYVMTFISLSAASLALGYWLSLGFQTAVVMNELNALKGQMQGVHSPTVSEATPWDNNDYNNN